MQTVDLKLTKLGFEFTDPTGSLAPGNRPVNFWVQERWPKPKLAVEALNACIDTPSFRGLVVNDMHDGDQKLLKVSHESNDFKITPYNNNQTWKIAARFDNDHDCTALVNFDVPNKPNPPPVPLNGRVWGMASIGGADKNALLFTDPSGNIANPEKPLNVWVPSNK